MGIFYLTESELEKDMEDFRQGNVEPGRVIRCIDDHFSSDSSLPFDPEELNLPETDRLYTIRDVVDTGYGVGIRLKEVKNKKYYFSNINQYEEPVFGLERFEPHYEVS